MNIYEYLKNESFSLKFLNLHVFGFVKKVTEH